MYLTELLWKYPPFCYNDYEKEMRRINILFDERNLLQIRTPDSELQTEFLRFCVGIIRIPIAMYHFYAAGRFFELDYLRRLKKRNETHFAMAAHDCFSSKEFWDELRELQSWDRDTRSADTCALRLMAQPSSEAEIAAVGRADVADVLSCKRADLFIRDLVQFAVDQLHADAACILTRVIDKKFFKRHQCVRMAAVEDLTGLAQTHEAVARAQKASLQQLIHCKE